MAGVKKKFKGYTPVGKTRRLTVVEAARARKNLKPGYRLIKKSDYFKKK